MKKKTWMRLCKLLCPVLLMVFTFNSVGYGVPILGGEPTSDYPTVVKLSMGIAKYTDRTKRVKSYIGNLEMCTGFIVSHNTIITAAHCIHGNKFEKYQEYKLAHPYEIVEWDVRIANLQSLNSGRFGLKPLRMYANPRYVSSKSKTTYSHDISVLVFADQTFRGIEPLKIASKVPEPKTKLRLVGFGGDQSKTTGVSEVDENSSCLPSTLEMSRKGGYESRYDPPVPDGKNAIITHGDSGSPVLLESDHTSVVGVGVVVISDKNGGYPYISCAASPISSSNLEFLKKTVKDLHAVINGIE